MEILKIGLALHMIDDDDTAEVKVKAKNGDVADFFVQTADSLYRSDLGCLIGSASENNGDIDVDDYPLFDFDLIIKAAEEYVRSQFEIKETNNNDYILKVYENEDKVKLESINPFFINSSMSSYTTQHNYIATFESEKEAIEFADSLEEMDEEERYIALNHA